MRFFCTKTKGTRGTANSASSGTFQSWQRVSRKHTYLKKHVFSKNTFFSQNTSMVASWAPAAQGPSHDATFYAPWAHPFYFCKLHTFAFFGPVSVFFAHEGPPNEFFGTVFGRVFGPARVRISYAFSLRSDSFATSKKCALVCAYKRANMRHGRRPHA